MVYSDDLKILPEEGTAYSINYPSTSVLKKSLQRLIKSKSKNLKSKILDEVIKTKLKNSKLDEVVKLTTKKPIIESASTKRKSKMPRKRNQINSRTEIKTRKSKKDATKYINKSKTKLLKTKRKTRKNSQKTLNEKLLLSKDLFIVKNKSLDDILIPKNIVEDITCQKIEDKCNIVKEHCAKCTCITPRLHIYLLSGHHCNSTCLSQIKNELVNHEGCYNQNSMDNFKSSEIKEEEVNEEFFEDASLDDLQDESRSESGSLIIDTDNVVNKIDDEHLSIKKDNFRTKRKCKKQNETSKKIFSEKIYANKTNMRKQSTNSELKIPSSSYLLSNLFNVKEEPSEEYVNDSGISVSDFQNEFENIELSNINTAMPNTVVPSKDVSNLLNSFESLIKEEPNKDFIEDVSNLSSSNSQSNSCSLSDDAVGGGSNGVFTIKSNKLESKEGTVVGTVSFISPTKMKILFSPLKNNDSLDQDLESETKSDSTTSKIVETKYLKNKTVQKKNKFEKNLWTKDGETWNCSLCLTNFLSFNTLADHLEKHQNSGHIVCLYCQKSFGDKTNMKRHMRVHTGERPYQCKICGKRFSLPGNFKKHRDIHENVRSEPCEVCGKTFRRKEHLKYHMRTHTGEKPFSCSLCSSTFTARYSLQIHMNVHLGKKPYKCSHCSKAFCDKSTMRKHIRVHTGEKPFKCKLCNKEFSESGTLSCHMATHTEERPFSCDSCEMKFKTCGGLRQHCKIHSGEKLFECKYCGMRFIQRYNMTMHERIHTNEKPFSCSDCGRCFRSRSCLAKHIVVHGGDQERKHTCGHCQKKFFRKAHLKRHINMHLGLKDYQCIICYKKFCSSANLQNHVSNFHSEGARKFPCEKCGKIFRREVYVSTHKCPNFHSEQHVEKDEIKIEQIV